jgi:3-oxo-5-alpha-steroid 4-dehydrogenase 1
MHYIYRALLCPLVLNPSMAPIHIFVALVALGFQLINSTCIAGWLASYGPLTAADWAGHKVWIQVGMIVFAFGFLGNIYHDDELREIRRAAARNQRQREADKQDQKKKSSVERVYMMPQNGLFRLVLYPHYFCEWIEWVGFWMIGGIGCIPVRAFVINEIATMLPRAIHGRRWYIARFGKEQVGRRKAVVPGII